MKFFLKKILERNKWQCSLSVKKPHPLSPGSKEGAEAEGQGQKQLPSRALGREKRLLFQAPPTSEVSSRQAFLGHVTGGG